MDVQYNETFITFHLHFICLYLHFKGAGHNFHIRFDGGQSDKRHMSMITN